MGDVEQDKISQLEKDLTYLRNRLDDLSDMKLILTELKTISEYQVKRSDKLESMVEELSKTTVTIAKEVQSNKDDITDINAELSSITDKSSIWSSEITKYVLFAILGIAISYIFNIQPM